MMMRHLRARVTRPSAAVLCCALLSQLSQLYENSIVLRSCSGDPS